LHLSSVGCAGGKKKETKLGLSSSKKDNFTEWYTEVVSQIVWIYGGWICDLVLSCAQVVAAELISYYDVSGCYILRPWAYAMWEQVQTWFDKEIKSMGVQNAYFPLFITEDVLNTEKDHVEGFAAEVAWVTKCGNTPLEKPIAIRPTSETVCSRVC
jgi:prolyl-tRNA synthetase